MTCMRILIIEAEPLQLELFADFLEAEGHTVTRVSSGAEACRVICNGGQWDVACIDPGGLGIPGEHELVRLIRTRSPGIIILVVSAAMNIESIARALQADGHLRKPFRLQEMTDLMVRVAREKERRTRL